MSDISEQSGQNAPPRFRARLAVYYGTDQQTLMTDYSVNISTGGIFLETGTMLPIDTPLIVEFMLPGKNAPISCNARVSWTNGPGDIKKELLPPGMGLQFLDLSLADLHAIREYLSAGELQPTW